MEIEMNEEIGGDISQIIVVISLEYRKRVLV